MKKVRAAVLGNSGMAGQVLQELLSKHPLVELVHASSGRERSADIDAALRCADVGFLALPSETSLMWAPVLLAMRKRVIDFSRAYRPGTELGRKLAVYGLTEMNRDRIRDAALVSNPGCYATSAILPLLAIRESVDKAVVVADSGISGAGEQPKAEGNIKAYKTGQWHDHVQEMKAALRLPRVLFAPRAVENLARGILSTIYVSLRRDIDVTDAIAKLYPHERFISVKRMASAEDTIGTMGVVGTNNCELGVWQLGVDVLIHSALDNLMKGAAGQAVQNMNVMCGFDEAAGLA